MLFHKIISGFILACVIVIMALAVITIPKVEEMEKECAAKGGTLVESHHGYICVKMVT